MDRNTPFIFISDNGPNKEGGDNRNAQFWGIKRDLYEGVIREKVECMLSGMHRCDDLYEGVIREKMIAWAPNMIKAGSATNFCQEYSVKKQE